jgi:cell division transport system permease protein
MSSQPQTPYVFSLVSITLVLFFLGFFGLLALSGKYVIDRTKEDLELKALLTEGTQPDQAARLLDALRERPYIKTIRYRSREDIFGEFAQLGGDFKEAMQGYNPFLSSINIQLNAEYIQGDSIRAISRELLTHREVSEVDYPISLIETVNYRSGWILQASAGVAVLLGLLAYLMILNTVKLAIFSRRLIIRSMQLIGATAAYVRWPFVRIGLIQGSLGGAFAAALLCAILLALQAQFDTVGIDIRALSQGTPTLILYGSLVLLGATLGYLSSRVALSRYLNKSLDEIA